MKTKKSNYEVYEYLSGYYGICPKNNLGGNDIFGGDPACEDFYNEDFVKDVYNKWDGTLNEHGRIEI